MTETKKKLKQGEPLKLKNLCPEWPKCLDRHWQEYEFDTEEDAESSLAFEGCCGCIRCVLLRHKVGCGDDCYMRKYPQYRNDEEMFRLTCGFDPEEIMEELEEEYGYATMDDVFKEGFRQILEKQKELKKAMEEKE